MRRSPGRGTVCAKAMRQGLCPGPRVLKGTTRRACGWSRVRPGEEEGEERGRGMGQVVQALVGSRRTWVFALWKVGALEGWQAERGQALTQMLTSTL